MAQMITDLGKPSQIVWTEDRDTVQRLPGTAIVAGILPVPRQGGLLTSVVSQVFPPVPSLAGDTPGFYTANWFLSPADGLTIENVRYNQGSLPPETHNVAEFMQWQHARLLVGPGPNHSQVIPVPLLESNCVEAALMQLPGIRTRDGKQFAWAATALFRVSVADASPAGLAQNIRYTVSINQSFLFQAPAADIEPTLHVAAVKVWPVMTVTVDSSDPVGFPPPSFTASLKMVFAPRLTRPDQHRPATQFPAGVRLNTNVPGLFTDTNDTSRPIPGQFTLSNPTLGPAKPFWDTVFDYAEPDLQKEIEFDAVVFPRTLTSTLPFRMATPQATASLGRTLLARRNPGQGEFDNIHIHPWVGFDDPTSGGSTNSANPPLTEAPIGADEVIHMHWRWGEGVPLGAVDADFPTHEEAEATRRTFRGYDSVANLPNSQNGAPLIPANQSLRVKVADPTHDLFDPTAGLLNPKATAVWYSPKFHDPIPRSYTQFFGHGFACGYRLKDLVKFIQTNTELLGDPFFPAFSYHDLRWNSVGKQRVLTASASKPAGLSRNRIGTTSLDEGLFTP